MHRCINRNRPVCGSNGRTYKNKCFARADSVDIQCQGECPCPIKFEEKIVISSTGEAADFQGGVLGEYKYDSQNNHYVQSNSEINHENYQPNYLFRNDDYEDWMVGPVSGEELFLWNGNPSQELPESDWEVFNGVKWVVDPDLKVTKGALKPCAGVKIYGLGPVVQKQGNYLGTYQLTPKMWNGHPVYKNNDVGLLHMGSDGYWSVSDRLGDHSIRGKPGRLCPSEINQWEYWNGYETQPAEILVRSI